MIQDPVWEGSFPDVGGVAVPIAEPRSGAVALVRFSRREAQERREANVRRHERLLRDFEALALDPVLIVASAPEEIDGAFLAWAEGAATEPVRAIRRTAALAALASTAAIAGLLALSHAAPGTIVAPPAPLVARATLDPPAAAFGDRISATIALEIDRRRARAQTLHLRYELAPLQADRPAAHDPRDTRQRGARDGRRPGCLHQRRMPRSGRRRAAAPCSGGGLDCHRRGCAQRVGGVAACGNARPRE